MKDGQVAQKEVVDNTTAVVKVADGASVAQAVTELSSDPDVEIAQPNYKYTLADDNPTDDQAALDAAANPLADTISAQTELAAQSVSINDPGSSEQYQLSASQGVDCYDAWSYAKGNNSIGVAVVDTGCLTSHSDLSQNVRGAYNAIDDSSDVTDSMGHGTHVAGIISARTNNGFGVSGVSYNANIIPIKAVSSSGYFYTSGLTKAYRYLIDNRDTYNIRVANLSLGGPGSCSSDNAVLKLVDEANADGILTVCAAGNASTNSPVPYASYPGDYPTCLSVINVKSDRTISVSSNYNMSGSTAKNISAPGSSIYSTTRNGDYGYMSGTSMASPVVAGVAAMVFAADSSLTPDECKQVLYDTATDLGSSGWDEKYGYGEVNAYAAVKQAASRKTLSSSNCTITSGSFTYDGSAKNASVTVTYGGKTLSAGTDYTLSYANNVNAGTASVTITGKGSYEGTATKTYTINPANVSGTMAITSLSYSTCTYNGSEWRPTPTVTATSSVPVKSSDYTVSYSNNVNAGTANSTNAPSVTVTGTGNFTGSISKTFTISPATFSSSAVSSNYASVASIADQPYTGSACKPDVSITWHNIKLTQGVDYYLTYSNNVGSRTATVTATVTITGMGNFTALSTTSTTFQIKPNIADAKVSGLEVGNNSFEYTGGAQTPKPTIAFDGKTLYENADYSLSYSNNTDVGTATITIRGINSYAGTTTENYYITAASIQSDYVSVTVPAQTYTGNAITPKPTVTYNGNVVASSNYTLSYSNNVNHGIATMTINGTGNFLDTTQATFTISPASIASAYASVASQKYTGSALTPAPEVTYNSKTLTNGIDYTVTYSNNTNRGTALATIRGMGNFAETSLKAASFTISPADVQRVYGDGALDTMKSIVDTGWSKGSGGTVVIATDGGYWDALSACGLAGLSNSPVVLTNGGSLSSQARAEIIRLGATKAIIVGGYGAVTRKVQDQLKAAGVSNFERLAGNSASDTARTIYEQKKGQWGATCIIATSDGFQDALAAAPYSYAKGAPMFLVESGSHVLSAKTLQDIKYGGFSQVIIVGGKYAVSKNVESQLQLAGVNNVQRKAGDSAYDTCQLIDSWAISQGMTAAKVGLATGENYPDALCGAALCGKNNSIIALASSNDYTVINGAVKSSESTVCQPYIFGGPGVVVSKMETAFSNATR